MNLQPLFSQPIIQQTYLDPGYSDHASDVWRIITASEDVVVRIYRWSGELDGAFWWGCHHLFGIDPRQVFELEPLNNLLNQLSSIPVPRVLRKGLIDSRQFVIVEFMPGRNVDDFRIQPEEMLENFGKALAQIHSRRFECFGHPLGHVCSPLASFHIRLVETMQALVDRFYSGNGQIEESLAPICQVAIQLRPPASASLVMIDLDPCQFLSESGRITAMVDTEGYVVGPRELDFIALEYILDRRAADAFAYGYSSVLPLPELSVVRPVYRYLYRLLEVQDSAELGTWMNQPVLFDGDSL